MRKYSKPEICIERFDMDIEILATVEMGTPLYEQLKVKYKRDCIAKGITPTDAGFTLYVQGLGHDTPTSGLCYFTPTMPS